MHNDTSFDKHLGHSVKRLYHLMGQYFNDVLRPYGVAQSQWYILYHIQASNGITQKALQDVLQVESATLTTEVNALQRKGWVIRTQSAADHRVNELRLTPAGEQLWASLPDPILAVRQRMLKGIKKDEEKIARKIIDKAIQNFEE